jgi:hypothetical protein
VGAGATPAPAFEKERRSFYGVSDVRRAVEHGDSPGIEDGQRETADMGSASVVAVAARVCSFCDRARLAELLDDHEA